MTEPVDPLAPNLIAARADGGRIAANMVRFARLLRDAGLPVGADQAALATRAVLAAGIESRPIFRAALRTVFVTRPEHRAIFDQAFRLLWQEPGLLSQTSDSPNLAGTTPPPAQKLSRRLVEPLLAGRPRPATTEDGLEIDARDTASPDELLRDKDFEQMSAAELNEARRIIARIPLLTEAIATRRYRPARHGSRLDLRAILRDMATHGPDHLVVARKARIKRRVPIAVLVDISGSMDTYARMMLHLLYALINSSTRLRVHAFLFGTRLTNVTRHLIGRDPDQAIDTVARSVVDWAGGTRIGDSLATFNRLWARRVLGQNPTVLLITDGLDREGGEGIARAARRLRASCRRLVWINPLLRYHGYEPLARGARELVRHVSEVRPCHNLQSLGDLAAALDSSAADRTNLERVR